MPQDSASGEHRLLRIGQQKGIQPRPGESWAEYRTRLFQTPTRRPERPQGHAHGLHALAGWLSMAGGAA